MILNPNLIKPLHLTGGKTGCLMIHGFTSTPTDIRPLSNYLHSSGLTVHEVLLPGHGTSFQDMAKYNWSHWLGAVESGLQVLKADCVQVWLVGFSMGGILAALCAARNSVDGLVCISAPIWPRPKRARYAWILKYFQKYAEMGSRQEYKFPSWRYEQVAVKSIADLMHLIRMAKRAFLKINIPTLVVQGSADRTIEPRSAQYIYKKLASPDKEIYIVNEGGHMLLLEPQYGEVCALVAEYISVRTGGKSNV